MSFPDPQNTAECGRAMSASVGGLEVLARGAILADYTREGSDVAEVNGTGPAAEMEIKA